MAAGADVKKSGRFLLRRVWICLTFCCTCLETGVVFPPVAREYSSGSCSKKSPVASGVTAMRHSLVHHNARK